MNPRDFCRERYFHTTILLTYSIDLIFFERMVLRDLWAGDSTEILLIGDRDQTQISLQREARRILHLGRRYHLAIPVLPAAQHAKLILRFGKNRALVWIGSNNLTPSGWGGKNGNRELATAWRVDADDASGVANLRELLHSLAEMVQGKAREILKTQLDQTWLTATSEPADLDRRILISSKNSSLAAQLRELWRGKSFRGLQILTGSTDKKGAFLSWAAQTFGIKKAVIGLDPQSSAFQPKLIEKLALKTLIVPMSANPTPHAKFYWFEGSAGAAAILGSANCSAAAWLVPPDRGGNVESIIVYENCNEKQFAAALAQLNKAEAHLPTEVEGLGTAVSEEFQAGPRPRYDLAELSLSTRLGQLKAVVNPPVGQDAAVEVDFNGLRAPLLRSDAAGVHWSGAIPDFLDGLGTRFGRLSVRSGKHTDWSSLRWLDEEEELLHASKGTHIVKVLNALGQPPVKTSQISALLRELAEVSAVILDERSFPDPPSRTMRTAGESEKEVLPVKPEDLVKSLTELETKEPFSPSPPGLALPLLGVMRVLFVDELEAAEVTLGEDSPGDSEEKDDTDGPEKPRPQLGPNPELLPDSMKKRFVKQVERFQARFSDRSFSEKCTAVQLVQAVAYLLAVATLGLKGGWIDVATFSSWVMSTTDRLFRMTIGGNPKMHQTGLLAMVRDRYRKGEKEETFKEVVGDGSLWVALAIALSGAQWKGAQRGLQRALALRDVLYERNLIVRADAQRLRALLSRTSEGDLRRSLLVQARNAALTVKEIEKLVAEKFEKYISAQIGARQLTGDPIWRPEVGFGISLEDVDIETHASFRAYLQMRAEEARVRCSYFANVRLASQLSPYLARALSDLAPCWPGHEK